MSKKNDNKDRSKFDMDQALAMKGKPPQRGLYSKSRTYGDTKNKVNASLRGLDVAGELANKGQLKEARSTYERHIETLINVLNEMKSSDKPSSEIGLSKDVLKEITRVALTDAESIKEKINQRGEEQVAKKNSSNLATKTPIQGTKSPRTGFFGFGKSKSTREVQRKKVNDPPQIQTSKSTEGHTSIEVPLTKVPSTKVPLTKVPLTKVPSKPIQPRKKSNLNYKSNDPFITTIKNDMYVDSNTLTTTWKDIAGLVDAKRALQEAAILPLLRPDLYTGLRSPPKGILLYGPPGTGKTMLVKAVAHESQCILFACSASSMTSKWVGEGEKMIRTLFRMASDVAPSIVFIDEMDSLLGRRKSDGNSEGEGSRRFKTEFMVQMDGIAAGSGEDSKRMLLIGATNCPWDIDDAVMRRFQRRVYIPLPDKNARLALCKNMVSKSNGGIEMSTKDVNEVAKMTDGFSCSDISSIANEASFYPLRDVGGIQAIKDIKAADVRPIQLKDFKSAILSTKKSVSRELLKRYDEWEEAQSTRG